MFGISLNDRQPIHEQVTTRITQMVLSGAIEPQSPLPSVRELAAELGVNPNTIQRAYSELERVGVTYSVNGKGRFVTDDVERVRKAKIEEQKRLFRNEVKKLKDLGASKEEAMAEVSAVYEKGDGR